MSVRRRPPALLTTLASAILVLTAGARSSASAQGRGGEWLTGTQITALPDVVDRYAVLGIATDSVRVVDPLRGRVFTVGGGRATARALGCGGGAQGAVVFDTRALLLRADTLVLCDIRNGRAISRTRLSRRPMGLGGWNGRDVSMLGAGGGVSPELFLVDPPTGRTVVSVAAAEVPGLVDALPGGVPNPWVPLTVSGRFLVAANASTFDIVWVDSAGRVRHRQRPAGLPIPAWTDQDRRTFGEMTGAAARMGAEALRGPKPFFRRDALAGDDQGRLWIATSAGHPDSTLLVRVTVSGALQRAWIPGAVTRLAVRGDRLALLTTRSPRGRTTSELREYRIRR